MRRTVLLLIVSAMWARPGFGASHPDDIEFRIRFPRNSSAYHSGESIDVVISYSSQSEKKYRGMWTSPRPEFGSVTLRIAPTDGVVDLRDLIRGWAGSSIGSEGYLGTEPREEKLDLSDWYRFRTPGHYSLTARSTAVSRVKSAEEGGGEERLTLESNTLEFDILPADPSWSAAELAEIERVVDHSEDPQEQYAALHRLAILDTSASVQKLIGLYLSQGLQGDPSGNVRRGLNNSSPIDLIIKFLESSLSDPKRNSHGVGADLLAEFQVRKELGTCPHHPDDPAREKEWNEKIEERNKAYEKYFAKANALLLASIERRTGAERTAAIYEAWNNAERQNAGKPEMPANLARLRLEVLALGRELGPGQQVQFLYSEWPILPHEQLRPIVESLANNRREDAESSREEAYKLWCEDWPRDCSAAMISDATKPGTRLSRTAILLLSEAEHPELDAMLEAQLRIKESNTPQDWMTAHRMAAVVLRAGSRKLRPEVDAYLDRIASYQGDDCEIQGYLIGFLFRFAASDAANRIVEVTQREKGSCGTELFRTLIQVRYTDELIPLAVKTLDSPNLQTAGTAALFLGAHGPASAEVALWRRLDALRKTWGERSAELRAAETRILESGIQGQTAQLEQELASALMTGVNWKLAPEEKERLREGCLTGKCRDIADGKMSFGL
jgi:hypothetical protein